MSMCVCPYPYLYLCLRLSLFVYICICIHIVSCRLIFSSASVSGVELSLFSNCVAWIVPPPFLFPLLSRPPTPPQPTHLGQPQIPLNSQHLSIFHCENVDLFPVVSSMCPRVFVLPSPCRSSSPSTPTTANITMEMVITLSIANW